VGSRHTLLGSVRDIVGDKLDNAVRNSHTLLDGQDVVDHSDKVRIEGALAGQLGALGRLLRDGRARLLHFTELDNILAMVGRRRLRLLKDRRQRRRQHVGQVRQRRAALLRWRHGGVGGCRWEVGVDGCEAVDVGSVSLVVVLLFTRLPLSSFLIPLIWCVY
jgi:hypothetical protein